MNGDLDIETLVEWFFSWSAEKIRKARKRNTAIRIWLSLEDGGEEFSIIVQPLCSKAYPALPAIKFVSFHEADEHIKFLMEFAGG